MCFTISANTTGVKIRPWKQVLFSLGYNRRKLFTKEKRPRKLLGRFSSLGYETYLAAGVAVAATDVAAASANIRW